MVEAPLHKIENIHHDNLAPFSGPGGRRFKSSLPDHLPQGQVGCVGLHTPDTSVTSFSSPPSTSCLIFVGNNLKIEQGQ